MDENFTEMEAQRWMRNFFDKKRIETHLLEWP